MQWEMPMVLRWVWVLVSCAMPSPSDCHLYWREIWILLLAHKGDLGLKSATEHDTCSCKGNIDKHAGKQRSCGEKYSCPSPQMGLNIALLRSTGKTWSFPGIEAALVGYVVLELSPILACGLCTSTGLPWPPQLFITLL